MLPLPLLRRPPYELDDRQMGIDMQPIIGRRYGLGCNRRSTAAATVMPATLPLHPVWPLRGTPTTDRTGRLSQPIGWDGTPNLTEAQATALKKLRTKVQTDPTAAAVEEAAEAVRLAMSASGTMPVFMYNIDVRSVNVPVGHPWHGMDRSHSLLRCDNTIFGTQRGGASSGNAVRWMGKPCVPDCPNRKELMPSNFNIIDRRLTRGRCPYRGGWKSGLDHRIIWPPVEVHLVEGDDRCHSKMHL